MYILESSTNGYKNLNVSPKDIISMQNYIVSLKSDAESKDNNIVDIGIHDSIKKYLNIKLEFLKDNDNTSKKANLYVKEMNDDVSNCISFAEANDVAKYIDDLITVSIYAKIYNIKLYVNRNQNDGSIKNIKCDSLYATSKNSINKSEEVVMYDTNDFIIQDKDSNNLEIEYMKEAIVQEVSNMDLVDIEKSNLSEYEFRKVIGMTYENVELTKDELEALSLYKAGWFKKINSFLRGDISDFEKESKAEELFFKNIKQIVKVSDLINSAQEKFVLNKDMQLMRTEGNEAILNNDEIVYNSFVSTTRTPQLFNNRLEGINQNGYMVITIPKGTHFLPMDLVREQMMNFESSIPQVSGGDAKYEEGEFLLPMCEVFIDSKGLYKDKIAVNSSFGRELNLMDILSKRIDEYKDKIIKYNGEEKYEELIGFLNEKTKKYSIKNYKPVHEQELDDPER